MITLQKSLLRSKKPFWGKSNIGYNEMRNKTTAFSKDIDKIDSIRLLQKRM